MDVLDRNANTRDDAVQWAADLILEVRKGRRRIAELEATIRKMVRFIPGGSSVDPQWLADELRAIAGDADVTID